jgi:hypothetical protein
VEPQHIAEHLHIEQVQAYHRSWSIPLAITNDNRRRKLHKVLDTYIRSLCRNCGLASDSQRAQEVAEGVDGRPSSALTEEVRGEQSGNPLSIP